jgi:hypothetical protein
MNAMHRETEGAELDTVMRSVTGILSSLFYAGLETNSTKKLIEIVYNLLIEAVQLGTLVCREHPTGERA